MVDLSVAWPCVVPRRFLSAVSGRRTRWVNLDSDSSTALESRPRLALRSAGEADTISARAGKRVTALSEERT